MDDLKVSNVRNISVVILIRTDTTLDHSQKAEKVWPPLKRAKDISLNGMYTMRKVNISRTIYRSALRLTHTFSQSSAITVQDMAVTRFTR